MTKDGDQNKEVLIQTKDREDKAIQNNKLYWVFLFCLGAFGVNILCNFIIGLFQLPMYLDTVGTIVTAALGGALPGIFVALCTNLVLGFGNPESVYFGILNVLIAVVTALWWGSKYRKKWWSKILLVLVIAGIGGGLGFVLTWNFSGFSMDGYDGPLIRFFYETLGWSELPAQLTATMLWDTLDKTISLAIALLLIKVLPMTVKLRFPFTGWKQTPMSERKLEKVQRSKLRVMSLGTKIIMVMLIVFTAIALVATIIGRVLFEDYIREEHSNVTAGIARLVSEVIDPEMVEEYLSEGESAPGYQETKELLEKIRDSYPGVEFLYVYQILDDGCHVVFDLDTEEFEGAKPGMVIPFDESFGPYLSDLLAGREIPAIISDDTYGWLLTVYQPIYDKNGKCVCYAAADVAMRDVEKYTMTFVIKMASLFLGFFALLLAFGLWLSNYHLIYPINAMSYSASAFTYDSEEAREKNVEKIRALNIYTGDELENLYHAFVKTTEDSQSSFAQMQHKTEMISKLQSGLIMVLADMVENRDESTGDHVRKTAAYTKVIMEKMRELGYQKETLTDEYIFNVVRAAPLHDIGKIQVSDTILNKPGKLNDDEFEKMKTHTTAGRKIIEQAIESIPEADYLKEAMNVAAYHHEKWNGKGYPYGLAGEEIPLSARIMAVADVFDALVSERCYKKPFPFEKAMEIIEKDAGTHFDPQVAEAFLLAKDEVKAIADLFQNGDSAVKKDFFSTIA